MATGGPASGSLKAGLGASPRGPKPLDTSLPSPANGKPIISVSLEDRAQSSTSTVGVPDLESREDSKVHEDIEGRHGREESVTGEDATERDSALIKPAEVMRLGSEIDTFMNRGRVASTVRLRPFGRGESHLNLDPAVMERHSHSSPDTAGTDEPRLFEVVSQITRKNSFLGPHHEVKQVPLGDEWVEPFIGTDAPPVLGASPHLNVVRLSMSVNLAKAKLDGTAPKTIAKHHHQDDSMANLPPDASPVVLEPGRTPTAAAQPPATPPPTLQTAKPPEGKAEQMRRTESNGLALPPRKELMMGTRSEDKDDEDWPGEGRKVRMMFPARYGPAELCEPPDPTKAPLRSVLKQCYQPFDGLKELQRQEAYIARHMDRVKTACKFMKYNLAGKPSSRYFHVNEDGTELLWTKTNPAKGRNKQSLTAEKPRKRYFADVRGIYYGPYNNKRVFRRFLDNKDQFDGSGKDWLCITVAFDDRTLDFCCTTDEQVSAWFLCMQALAPRAASYLTCGSVLWRRLIMKLNAYGLNPAGWPGPLVEPAPGDKKGKKGDKEKKR